eukprot:NODE_1078_length_1720_cov_37.128665_g954_i0.p1 GENE.NODE_1078_length_1720_cov_37.128665_g954_i0~~NODE_1078_length_1720_cov_37.128665_g954_i0.p1  ORF type:complete len:509 (-),score=79.34 NODE_1078_length_1720_cov_37.128665_g954_i0:194-1672(-)
MAEFCAVCLDEPEASSPSSLVTVPCKAGHRICQDCLLRCVQVNLKDHAATACPQVLECKFTFTVPELKVALGRSFTPQMEAEANAQAFEHHVKSSRSLASCPGPDCQWVVEVSDPTRRWNLRCPLCRTSSCTMCMFVPYHYCSCEDLRKHQAVWLHWQAVGRQKRRGDLKEHELRHAKEKQKRLQEYRRDEEYKERYCALCPHCNRIVQKLEGCDAMVCGRDAHGGNAQDGCGQSFDWKKAQKYKVMSMEAPVYAARGESGVSHGEFLRCDECHSSIVGLRFQCLCCPSYELCEACEPRLTEIDFHPSNHVFRIHSEAEHYTESARRRHARRPSAAEAPCASSGGMWEFQTGSGHWCPCPPHVQQQFSEALRTGQMVFTTKINEFLYQMDAAQQIQRNLQTDTTRRLRYRQPQGLPMGTWQFLTNSNRWKNCAEEMQPRLWEAHRKGDRTVDLGSHVVDFSQLVQTNKQTGKVRGIRVVGSVVDPLMRGLAP